MSRADDGERAQASIEVVALVPALALVLLCAWQAAMAGWALTAAESASRAGARAALVGRPRGRRGARGAPGLDARRRDGVGVRRPHRRHAARAERRARLRAPDLLVDTRGPAVNARGQASIELVFAACLAGARGRGNAAALRGCGGHRPAPSGSPTRPPCSWPRGGRFPAGVKDGARVEVGRHAVRVAVPVRAPRASPSR